MNYRRLFFFLFINLFAIALVLTNSGFTLDPKTAYLIWDFEGDSGNVVKDKSGNGNDGTLTNVDFAAGKNGKSGALLKGNGSKIVTTTAKGVGKTFFSECLWVQFNDINTEAQYGYIRCTGTANARYFYFSSWNSAGAPHDAMHCGTIDTAGNWGRGISTAGKLYKKGQWHFVAGVIDTKNGFIKVYLDGAMVQQANIGPGDTPGTPVDISVGGAPENYQWLSGTIDDVVFFNVVLSEDDINTIMKNGITKSFAVQAMSKLPVTWANIKK